MEFVSVKLIVTVIILVFFLVYWMYDFVMLYHLTRFGIGTQPKKLAAVFLLGSIVLVIISAALFANLHTASVKTRLQNFGTGLLGQFSYKQ